MEEATERSAIDILGDKITIELYSEHGLTLLTFSIDSSTGTNECVSLDLEEAKDLEEVLEKTLKALKETK